MPGVTYAADGNPANAPCGAGVFTTEPGPTHGTRVASVIGGAANGVAKGVTIIPVKVWTCGMSGSTVAWCWALDWILGDSTSAQNCPGGVCRRAVVNISGGLAASSATEQCQSTPDPLSPKVACRAAFENNVVQLVQSGITVVAAANNLNNNSCDTTPARMGQGGTSGFSTPYHVITVGGSTDVSPIRSGKIDGRWVRRAGEAVPGNALDTGSNYGTCVDIYAPAEHFRRLATMASNSSVEASVPYQSGTSYAAPIVTGLVARLLQREPWLTPDQIWGRLRDSASHPTCFDPPSISDPASPACNNSRFIFGDPVW